MYTETYVNISAETHVSEWFEKLFLDIRVTAPNRQMIANKPALSRWREDRSLEVEVSEIS